MRLTDRISGRFLTVAAWLACVAAFALWRHPEMLADASDRYRKARRLLAEGDTAAGLRALDRALALDSANAGYLSYRGHLRLEHGVPDSAAADFGRAVAAEEGLTEARLGLAEARLAVGDTAAARRELARSRIPAPDSALLRRRAGLHARAGAPERALADLRRLLEERPGDPWLLHRAADEAAAAGLWEQALHLAERAEERARDARGRRRAIRVQAWALDELDRPGEALARYREIAGPENLGQRARLALETGRHGEAAELYGELARRRPDDLRVRSRLARALERAGRLEASAEKYRRLTHARALDRTDRVRYVWLLARLERYREAYEIAYELGVPGGETDRNRAEAAAGETAAPGVGDAAPGAGGPAPVLRLRGLVAAWADHPAEAVGPLRRWLETSPRDTTALRALGGALESLDRPREAASAYWRLLEASPGEDPDLVLRIARLERRAGRPEQAILWYRKYLRGAPAPGPREAGDRAGRVRAASRELAAALLVAGRARESLALAARLAKGAAADSADLVLAARASTAAGEHRRAAGYLERLDGRGPLSPQRLRWLAGQYRATGEVEKALATYERALAAFEDPAVEAETPERERAPEQPPGADRKEGSPAPPELLEAVGDLRLDTGDAAGAVSAYRRIPGAGRSPEITLSLARALVASGEPDGAFPHYRRYLDTRPGDRAARLELARELAAAGRAGEALEEYRSYASLVGYKTLQGIRGEMARAALAAGEHAEAVHLAREALLLSRGEPAAANLRTRLVMARGLEALDRTRQAERVYRSLAEEPGVAGDALAGLGRIAETRDRLLRAWRLFNRALAAGVENRAAVMADQGRVALRRRDVTRARRALERADSLTALDLAARIQLPDSVPSPGNADSLAAPTQREFRPRSADSRADHTEESPPRTLVLDRELASRVDSLRRELRRLARPGVDLPGAFLADEFGVRSGFLRADASTWKLGRARLSGSLSRGLVEQDDLEFWRTRLTVAADRLYVSPAFWIRARAGVEGVDGADYTPIGELALHALFGDGSAAGLRGAREPLWVPIHPVNPRQYNRIRDLALVGRDFQVSRASGWVDLRTGRRRSLRLEAGGSYFEGDDNLHGFLYGHYQMGLEDSERLWAALRPNLYVETFRDPGAGYFSPDPLGSLGLAGHAVRRGQGWRLEAELNPQLLYLDEGADAGLHGVLDYRRRVGPLEAGVNLFLYGQTDGYWLLRGGLQLGFPPGGGR